MAFTFHGSPEAAATLSCEAGGAHVIDAAEMPCGIDIFVSNAVVAPAATIDNFPLKEFDRMRPVNIRGCS